MGLKAPVKVTMHRLFDSTYFLLKQDIVAGHERILRCLGGIYIGLHTSLKKMLRKLKHVGVLEAVWINPHFCLQKSRDYTHT